MEAGRSSGSYGIWKCSQMDWFQELFWQSLHMCTHSCGALVQIGKTCPFLQRMTQLLAQSQGLGSHERAVFQLSFPPRPDAIKQGMPGVHSTVTVPHLSGNINTSLQTCGAPKQLPKCCLMNSPPHLEW